jgi:hypothetical protein
MKREVKISGDPSVLMDEFDLPGVKISNYPNTGMVLMLVASLLILNTFSAFAQCKLKETTISGTEVKMMSSQGIRLTGNGRDYTYKFIKIGSGYFVSINYINGAVNKGIFSIDDSCPLVFLLDSKQKVILYPVNPLNVDPAICDHLFGKQGMGKIYYSILPVQIEQLTSSFYTDAHLYFKSDIKPEKSATDTWGTYFSYNTKKNRQLKQLKKLECMLGK